MSAQGFTATIASGTSTSDVIDLGSASFTKVYCNNKATLVITLQGSVDGTNFAIIDRQDDNIEGVSFTTQTVATALSGRWVPLNIGTRFIRVYGTTTIANGGTVLFSVVSN